MTVVIGVIREIKNNEFSVGLTPGGAHVLTAEGHTVLVETGAGTGRRFRTRSIPKRAP